MTLAEREFWLALYAAFMGIAKAIKKFKLDGGDAQAVTLTPTDSVASSIMTTEKGGQL